MAGNMTDKERFLDMLTGAQITFSVRRTSTQRDLVEVDSRCGALAFFEFSDEGILVDFDIEKDAY